MADERKYEAMDRYRVEHDALSDGAFFALAEEMGYSVDDWAAVCLTCWNKLAAPDAGQGQRKALSAMSVDDWAWWAEEHGQREGKARGEMP